MWPPSRSLARSASSRLTRSPSRSSPSDERRSVSAITSAPKRGPHSPTAVRHTPLTATESPSRSSLVKPDSKLSRAPSVVRSTGATVPRSPTSPVNTSPLLQPRGDQQVLGHALALERLGAQRIGDVLDALALQRVARVAAAEQQWSEEQPDLVDLPGVEERAGQVRAALQQQRRDAPLAEPVERIPNPRGLVLSRGDDHLGAAHLERLDRCARRGARHDDDQALLGCLAQQLRRERQARGGVEDHMG